MTDTAREAVARAICAADNHGWPDDTYDGRFSRRAFEKQADSAISAFTAWLQENGWQIAPKEPTETMHTAGDDWLSDASCRAVSVQVYRAMLAAAPKLESDRCDG